MFDNLMKTLPNVDMLVVDDHDDHRCVIFLRSGHTLKVPYSLQEVRQIIESTDDLIVEIDGALVNVDAIDAIEPISRINRKDE